MEMQVGGEGEGGALVDKATPVPPLQREEAVRARGQRDPAVAACKSVREINLRLQHARQIAVTGTR